MAAKTATNHAIEMRVDQVRRFNRFYTRLIGALDEGHLDSRYSLAEVRTLYEIAHQDGPTASDLGRVLGLDAGYLSRLLRELVQKKVVERTLSEADARSSHLRLGAKGRKVFAELDARARGAVGQLLAPLDEAARRRVVDAMQTIETTLAPAARFAPAPILIRGHRLGDMGQVVARQALLYGAEYGWNAGYEALVARIVAEFIERFDPSREHCWIAEQHDEMVGSVFLIRDPERAGVARLRLLYVEPAARGHGLGKRLVRECTLFARRAGYRTIALWTNSVLAAARRIYQAEGYRLVEEKPHHSFGHDLVGQVWELALNGSA